jgi:membrane fusion protein (multidrug efflux system)
MRLSACALLLLCGLIVVCGLVVPVDAQQGQPPSVTVGTVAAARKPIAKSADFVGRVEAVERVEVKARVTGYLEEVLFKEGDLVKQGDPL